MCDANYLGPKDTYNTSIIDPNSAYDMQKLSQFLGGGGRDKFYMDTYAVKAFTNKFIECNFKDTQDDYYRKIFDQAQDFLDYSRELDRYGWVNVVDEQEITDYLNALDPRQKKDLTDEYCDINCTDKSFTLKSPGGQKSIEQLFGSVNNLTKFCNDNVTYDACPVDCKVSEWSTWSECADGIQNRSRTIITQPLNNGKPCGDLQQQQVCAMSEPDTPPTDPDTPPTDPDTPPTDPDTPPTDPDTPPTDPDTPPADPDTPPPADPDTPPADPDDKKSNYVFIGIILFFVLIGIILIYNFVFKN